LGGRETFLKRKGAFANIMLNNIGFWEILQGVPPLGGVQGGVVTSRKNFFFFFGGVFVFWVLVY
jgi:hypothetical protein